MRIVVGLVCAGLIALACAGARAAGFPSVFATVEVRADAQLALPQWQGILRKVAAEQPVYAACRDGGTGCTSRAVARWQQLLAELADAEPIMQIRAVNRFANQIPYRTDKEVWGRSDYWASPVEFLKRAGDCEDYAILKYVSLRQLGFAAADLRMVVVQDTVRDLAHAVLVVNYEGRGLVLDNLSNAVVPQERTPQYVPYYSVNETARWAHLARNGQQAAGSRQLAAAEQVAGAAAR